MFESIGSVLSGIKQAGPVVLMGVAIATGMGVFATDGFIARLGLLELRNQHRAYVGGAFVLSVAMLGHRAWPPWRRWREDAIVVTV